MRHVRLFLVTKEVHMSSAELSSNRWLPQLNEHLKRERYSAKTAQRYVAVADAFLRILKSRRVAVESAETKHIAQYLQHALRLYRRQHGRSPKSFDTSNPFYWWRHSHTTAIKMLLRLVHGQRTPAPRPSAEFLDREVCQQYEHMSSGCMVFGVWHLRRCAVDLPKGADFCVGWENAAIGNSWRVSQPVTSTNTRCINHRPSAGLR